MADLLDLDKLAQASSAVSKLDKIRDVFELSEALYRSYPQNMKDEIDSTSNPSKSTHMVSAVLSMVHPEVREELADSLDEVSRFIMDFVTEDADCVVIPDDELKIMQEMMVFIQRMGKKSLRQLHHFLVASNDNEWGSVLLHKDGDGVEARHRFKLAPNVRDYFDM